MAYNIYMKLFRNLKAVLLFALGVILSNTSTAQTVNIVKITQNVRVGSVGPCLIIQTKQDRRSHCYIPSDLPSQDVQSDMRIQLLALLEQSQRSEPSEVPFVTKLIWQEATLYVFGRFNLGSAQFMRPATSASAAIEDFALQAGTLPTISENDGLSKSSYMFNENLLKALDGALIPILTVYLNSKALQLPKQSRIH